MTKIIIFGGTTEGRQLAEFCDARGIPALVCVASEYGQLMLCSSDCVEVLSGALDGNQMSSLFKERKPNLIVDATHPYASVVTQTMSQICDQLHIRRIRVVRSEQEISFPTGACIWEAANIEEAVEILSRDEKPILLTTGSKELHQFTKLPRYTERIYARVLPDSGVIAACNALGVSGKHVIAMQGPFSVELNQAVIRQIGAGWIVTKESGARGGFEEKIEAAANCNISIIVIGRPTRETGLSLQEAKRELLVYAETRKRKLLLIGTGMGSGRQITKEAMEALKSCDAVVGAPRLLNDFDGMTQGMGKAFVYLGHDILAWANQHPEQGTIAVLYSGDTGFYSGTASLYEALKQSKEETAWSVVTYPGISTVSCLCARLQCSWDHLYLGSLHGRDGDAAMLLKKHKRVFLLLGGEESLIRLCRQLIAKGFETALIRGGEQLGYPSERIFEGTARELQGEATHALVAVIIEREETEHEG